MARWLRSGDVDGASYAYLLHSSGAHNRSNAYRYYAVRPASSNAVNFKKAADTRAFGSVARIGAWLRSGNARQETISSALLNVSGGYNSGSTRNRYAVRPALHSSVKNFSADNSRIPFV